MGRITRQDFSGETSRSEKVQSIAASGARRLWRAVRERASQGAKNVLCFDLDDDSGASGKRERERDFQIILTKQNKPLGLLQ